MQDDQDRHELDSIGTGTSEKQPAVGKNQQMKWPRDSAQSSSSSTGSPANQPQPTTSTDWHLSFSIPDMESFSKSVRVAVTTGVITDRARKEIIQVLRTYITKHTVYPSPAQYSSVCQLLVTKFPKLRDQEGLSVFVSVYRLLANSCIFTFCIGVMEAVSSNLIQEL